MEKQRTFMNIYEKFALFPVKTEDQGIIWFRQYWIVEDPTPIEYLELLHIRLRFAEYSKALKKWNELVD